MIVVGFVIVCALLSFLYGWNRWRQVKEDSLVGPQCTPSRHQLTNAPSGKAITTAYLPRRLRWRGLERHIKQKEKANAR